MKKLIIEKFGRHPLSAYDIMEFSKFVRIPYFRGVYMRDTLPLCPRVKESMIVNLDSVQNSGSHWVTFIKDKNEVKYFDSFGVEPPFELLQYWKCGGGKNPPCVLYNSDQVQSINENICGHLCIHYLLYNMYLLK